MKVLPGEFGFIAQLNEGRHLKKRPTEFRVDQVLQCFDAKKFNFTKVGQEEVLFCFEESKDYGGYCDEMAVGKSPNIIAINVRFLPRIFILWWNTTKLSKHYQRDPL